MEVDNINTMEGLLRSLKLFSMEMLVNNFKHNGDVLFTSFDIHDITYRVNKNVVRDIATYARKNLDITKPINLHGIRFVGKDLNKTGNTNLRVKKDEFMELSLVD